MASSLPSLACVVWLPRDLLWRERTGRIQDGIPCGIRFGTLAVWVSSVTNPSLEYAYVAFFGVRGGLCGQVGGKQSKSLEILPILLKPNTKTVPEPDENWLFTRKWNPGSD